MPTVNYEVSGELSAPEDFTNGVYEMLREKSKLHLVAVRTDVDDLAMKRGDSNTIEFDLRIREIILLNNALVVSGYMFKGSEQGEWISIEVTDRARFSTFT